MQWTRALIRVPVALFATAVMLVAAPVHAAHVHHHDATAATMHAPCAACQVHAPAGTPPPEGALFVEPDGFTLVGEIHNERLVLETHGRIHACRAPPAILA